MKAKTIGLILFFLGLIIINGTTTIGFIWLLAGLPAPERPTEPTVMAALATADRHVASLLAMTILK